MGIVNEGESGGDSSEQREVAFASSAGRDTKSVLAR